MTAKSSQLQLAQQNLQNILIQKQQLEFQLIELNSAFTELESTDKAYKIIGKIMIASKKDFLQKDLEEKREVIEVRMRNFTAQEDKLKKSINQLQKEVVEEIKSVKQKEKNE